MDEPEGSGTIAENEAMSGSPINTMSGGISLVPVYHTDNNYVERPLGLATITFEFKITRNIALQEGKIYMLGHLHTFSNLWSFLRENYSRIHPQVLAARNLSNEKDGNLVGPQLYAYPYWRIPKITASFDLMDIQQATTRTVNGTAKNEVILGGGGRQQRVAYIRLPNQRAHSYTILSGGGYVTTFSPDSRIQPQLLGSATDDSNFLEIRKQTGVSGVPTYTNVISLSTRDSSNPYGKQQFYYTPATQMEDVGALHATLLQPDWGNLTGTLLTLPEISEYHDISDMPEFSRTTGENCWYSQDHTPSPVARMEDNTWPIDGYFKLDSRFFLGYPSNIDDDPASGNSGFATYNFTKPVIIPRETEVSRLYTGFPSKGCGNMPMRFNNAAERLAALTNDIHMHTYKRDFEVPMFYIPKTNATSDTVTVGTMTTTVIYEMGRYNLTLEQPGYNPFSLNQNQGVQTSGRNYVPNLEVPPVFAGSPIGSNENELYAIF
jgi:hypothetical protein